MCGPPSFTLQKREREGPVGANVPRKQKSSPLITVVGLDVTCKQSIGVSCVSLDVLLDYSGYPSLQCFAVAYANELDLRNAWAG